MLQVTKSRATEDTEKKGSGRSIQPLQSLARHWKLSLMIAFGILLIGVPYAWIKGKAKWRAEGSMFVSPRFLRNLEGDQENELQSNTQYREFVQQQIKTIDRFDILQAALAPGSKAYQAWHKPPETTTHAINRLRGQLTIASVPDTYLVTVSLDGPKPAGLADVVNSVMGSFVQTAHREALYDSDERIKNLENEKQQLLQSIARLSEEKTSLSNQLGTTVFTEAAINSYDSQLAASIGALSEARRARFAAEAALGPNPNTPNPGPGIMAAALQSALNDASLNTFKGALTQRKAVLLTSISGLSEQHPVRIAAEKEMQAIDRENEAVTIALRDRLANNQAAIYRDKLHQSEAVEKQIQAETEKLRQQIEDYSRGYQRSLQVGNEIDRLRKRMEMIEDRENYLSLETQAPGWVRVFSPALTPEEPTEAGRKKLLMMVMAASIVLALAVPIGIDYMDPRLKAPGELESHLGLPITGWLPTAQALDPSCLLKTAVSIRRYAKELRHRVLVVTALSHGGGSSTVSLGLGLALDKLGVRTIVVEANPLTSDSRYLGTNQAGGLICDGGLISWISGHSSERLPVVLGDGNLPDRVATGAGSLEDLLPVERLLPLLDRDANAWDLIVIDAAPLESSLATEELIRVFGSVLLVVDSQTDKKKDVTRALDKLDLLAPDAFGAVLNKVSGPLKLFPKRKMLDDSSAVLTS